jgi:hypothetical protein
MSVGALPLIVIVLFNIVIIVIVVIFVVVVVFEVVLPLLLTHACQGVLLGAARGGLDGACRGATPERRRRKGRGRVEEWLECALPHRRRRRQRRRRHRVAVALAVLAHEAREVLELLLLGAPLGPAARLGFPLVR